ncbi:hypothetical protein [Paractinoplanes globisporus]|uniref:Uncharacterized protein n=1 Tax=Paractinoplanes globisporus TaxID=113565 RepID=A0ABW6WA08_9ACTN|nr:hypothetical protein [Actinoplanes globisporus]
MSALVLDPDLRYADLTATLRRFGFALVREPSAPPLVPGEPEFGTWRRADDIAVYTCNPVVRLRLLDLSGVAEPDAIRAELPLLHASALPRLLRSSDPEQLLLGVLAAGAMHAYDQLPALRALGRHRDSAVARAAVLTARGLAAR